MAVWPPSAWTRRGRRAWTSSITDHIEYQPHKADVPTNHNRPYEIAFPRAKERGILLIRGTEITRDTPPGHFNALFLDDVNPLDTPDLLDCMAAAAEQRAFIWWNHPGWKPDKKGWFDIHTTLYEKKHMHGIEVVNGRSYPRPQWAYGRPDVRGHLNFTPMLEQNGREASLMTLVFAGGKTLAAANEALVAGRTLVWYEGPSAQGIPQ